jgi:hypothetical protein
LFKLKNSHFGVFEFEELRRHIGASKLLFPKV